MSLRFDVQVSIALGADITADPDTWSWTDITAYTQGGVEIHRGRSDWQSQAQPSWCRVQLDNTDGRFSRLNPLGVYYGQLRKNTPLRIRACATGGTQTVRFIGFISEWPLRWTHGEKHKYVPVRADGVLRRLGQGRAALRSALYRVAIVDDPIAYWPLEDESGSTAAASAIVGGAPALISGGTVEFGVYTDLAAAARTPDLSAGFLFAPVRGGSASSWHVEFAMKSGYLASAVARVYAIGGGDTHAVWRLFLPSVAGDTTDVFITNADGTVTTTALLATSPTDFENEWHHYAFTASASGSNVVSELWIDGVLAATSTDAGSLARVNQVMLNQNLAAVTSAAHLLVGDGATPSQCGAVIDGYAGELGLARFARLCTEESVAYHTDGSDVSSYAMGPQTTNTLLNLLRECEAASAGVIFERKNSRLGLQPASARENLPVSLTLDYDLGHIVDEFEPADDDRLTVNDVTVTRTGGSSARVEQTDGPMGTDPETGAGRYDAGLTINLHTDSQVIDHAGWLLNLGTVNEYRYPTVNLFLHKPSMSSLITTWTACEIGSRITIDNLPTDVTYNLGDQIIEGYIERIDSVSWGVELNLSPYSPYRVGVLGEETMTLLTAEDTTSTTWRIACDPSFTTESSDLPVALVVDGEVVSVTAVSPVTVSILAGTPSHADNSPVTPANPSHAEGDLLLLVAAIRSSGTGTVDNIGGIWNSFGGAGNVEVFYAYATSAATADPVVTFTGGAAGDTTSAVVSRCRGLHFNQDQLNHVAQLNGSAQDIAFPVYVQEGDTQIMHVAWKQDDYTSVASSGAGLTEILEASTTTGNDQSLYVARGTGANPAVPIAAGSDVVTGGAAAISRAFFFTLLRGVADLTVTRSVNGVVTSHAQLATVEVYQPAVLAL